MTCPRSRNSIATRSLSTKRRHDRRCEDSRRGRRAAPTARGEGMSEPQGLASADARRRLTELGPNEPAPPQHVPFIRHALSLFSNPLVLILLLASGVSATLGEIVNAAIIVVIVLLSVSLNFVQTYRSQRAVDRLGSCRADRHRPARRTVARDGPPRPGARRRHPSGRGRPGSRRRDVARSPRPARAGGGAHRRVAAGREDRARPARGADAGRSATQGLPRHVGRQRHGDRGRRRRPARGRPSATSRRACAGGRPRPSSSAARGSSACFIMRDRRLPGAVRLCGQRGAASTIRSNRCSSRWRWPSD